MNNDYPQFNIGSANGWIHFFPSEQASKKISDIEIVLDVDQFGAIRNVEVIGLREGFGINAAGLPSNDKVRTSYDGDADALMVSLMVKDSNLTSTLLDQVVLTGAAVVGSENALIGFEFGIPNRVSKQ